MTLVRRLSAWGLIVAATAFLAVAWITTALAQADGGDGDGLDGDEMAMPILLGVAALGIVAVLALQRFPKRSRN